jgi:hypothetical protein
MRYDKQLVAAFVDAYNCANGHFFVIDSWPEDENRNSPAVEALARDGNQLMAIEHTLAQPFLGERQDSAVFRRVIAPIELDESLLQLSQDITLSTGVGAVPIGVDWDESAILIRDWLRRELPLIPEGTSRCTVPGLAFELEFVIHKTYDDTPGFKGSIFVMRIAPEDTLEKVLEKALREKLPKLMSTIADTRILLLERADVLGGYSRFGTLLQKLLAGTFAQLKPDEVWLANTFALEREDALSFYKIWPTYFEHRITRDANKIFRKM